MKKGLVILLILAMVGSACFAAGTEENDGRTKIGVSIMELSAYTWYLGVEQGCEKWATDHPEAGFYFQYEDSRSDVSTMLNNIDSLITGGAKAIILFPADASSAIPTMKQYVKQGIPFVIGDYKQTVKSQDDIVWETFVGHNMRALGEKAGEVAVKYLKTTGKKDPTCLFISRPTSGQVSSDRFEGFRDTVLASFPNGTVLEEGDVAAGSRDSAQSLMENVLQRESVIDVVCGHNDAEVIGAYNAAKAANRTETKFIGIAGNIDVFNFIKNGNDMWLAEILQNPVDLGYQATEAIYESYVEGKTLPEDWNLPEPEAVTPDNISTYDFESWEWL